VNPKRTSLIAAALIGTLQLLAAGPADASGTRIFKNREGKKIEAEILAKSDNHVRVRTTADKEFSIELATLSEADQEFVRNWVDPQSKEAMARTDIARVMEARGFTGVPFTNKQNHLFIRCEIGGKELTFLLDSGAMTSILTPSAAKELGLTIAPSNAQVQGVGGGASIEGQTTANDCRFGGNGPVTMDFVVMNLPAECDGLIGSDFFRSKQAMLDYAGETLWLRVGDTSTAGQ
jgi:hypothetical protein